jgi:hypothetical protein
MRYALGGTRLGAGRLKSGRWALGLSEEAVRGIKLQFRVVSPKIRSVSLMGVNLWGRRLGRLASRKVAGRGSNTRCVNLATTPLSRALRKLHMRSDWWFVVPRISTNRRLISSSTFPLSRSTDSSCFHTLVFIVNQALVMSRYRITPACLYVHYLHILNKCRLIVNQAFHLPCVMPCPPLFHSRQMDGRTDGHLLERRKARNTVKVMVKARGHSQCRESGRAYITFRVAPHGYSLCLAAEHAPYSYINVYLCNAEAKMSPCVIMRRYSSMHS